VIEIAINRFSYTCPALGMLSAPAGVLTLVTSVDKPGAFLMLSCACGEDHKVKFAPPKVQLTDD
jgi:hypothetical protein